MARQPGRHPRLRPGRPGQPVRRFLQGRRADRCPVRLHRPAVVLLRRDGHDHGHQRRGQADRRPGLHAGHQPGAVRGRPRGSGGRCQLLLGHHRLRGVHGRRRRGRPHGSRQRGHRRSVRHLALPHPDRHDGAVPGGHPGADRGRLPDHVELGQGDRLGRLHDLDPGVRDDADDAVHLLHHQRHRHGLHHLHGPAPGRGPRPGDPGADVRRLGGLRLLLPDAGPGPDLSRPLPRRPQVTP
ncbi:hypothetical protein SGPA1_50711 [Streptomyces misionensis JCM 4497]